LPEPILRRTDRFVGNQDGLMDVALRDRQHTLADAPRRKRVRRQAAGFGIDRMSGLQRFRQGRGR